MRDFEKRDIGNRRVALTYIDDDTVVSTIEVAGSAGGNPFRKWLDEPDDGYETKLFRRGADGQWFAGGDPHYTDTRGEAEEYHRGFVDRLLSVEASSDERSTPDD